MLNITCYMVNIYTYYGEHNCLYFNTMPTILFCRLCVGVDIDPDALAICQQNIREFDLGSSTDLVQMDITDASASPDSHSWERKFDCVVMNPPFGTKNNKGSLDDINITIYDNFNVFFKI